jgi:hypothetical protein
MSSLPIQIQNCELTQVGAIFPETLEMPEWLAIGRSLLKIETCRQFLIGDWINFGESRWGEKYKGAMSMTGLEYQTVADFSRVCKQVDITLRNVNLTFNHHRAVSKLQPKEQAKYLKLAEENGLSVADLRELLKDDGKTADSGEDGNEKPANFVSALIQGLASIRRIEKSVPVEEWPQNQKEVLKTNLEPLVEIYNRI